MKKSQAQESVSFVMEVWDKASGGNWGSLQYKLGGKFSQEFFRLDKSPQERMVDYLLSLPKGADIYFCPLPSDKASRVKSAFSGGALLWADLDEADPEQDPLPSITWETSPGRYQALWFLKKRSDLEELEPLNRHLTYSLGADKGGWDVGQVLRIPGTTNHKPAYDKPTVTIIRHTPSRYTLRSLEKTLGPPPPPPESVSFADETHPPLRLSQRLSRQWVDWEDIPIGERSEKPHAWAWALLEKGMTPEWVIKIVAEHPLSQQKWGDRSAQEIRRSVEKWKAKAPSESIEEWTPPRVWTAQDFLSASKEIRWMVKGMWLEETVGMVSGPPKAFKTWIALDLAISVASLTPFLGMKDYSVIKGKREAVLVIQEEDPKEVIASRLSRILVSRGFDAGGFRKSKATVNGRALTLEHVGPVPLYIVNSSGFNLQDPNYINWLEDVTRDLKLRLVILDPLIVMLGDVNEYKGGEVARLLRPIKLFREKYHTSFCFVHHITKKTTSDRPGEQLYGSFAFHAWLESALHVRPIKERQWEDVWAAEEEGPKGAGPVRLKREFKAAGPGPVLELNFGDLRQYNPIVTEGEGFQVADQELTKLVEVLLEEGPMHLKDLRELMGIPRRRLDRLIRLGQQRGRLDHEKKGDSPRYWKLRAIQ